MPLLVRNVAIGFNEPEDVLLGRLARILKVPARAVRSLTDEQVAMLRLSAAHYADKAGHYAANLLPVGTR